MKLVLEKVDNGFLASHYDEEETIEFHAAVFEEPEDAALDPDPKTMAHLLRYVLDYFGPGSKHDKERVYVYVLPGDNPVLPGEEG